MSIIITILIVLSAGLHLRAQYIGPDTQVYIFNPLTMVLIIGLAVLAPKVEETSKYKRAIIIGLIFSIGGDILLMLPNDLFVPGLASFLIAQIIYTYAFLLGRKLKVNSLSILPFAVFGVVVFVYLAPGLGALTIPVIVYISIILMMGWQAWEQWDSHRERWALLAFLGALFFVLSDTILAINKFRAPFEASTALVLITYTTAQWLITMSIRREI